MGLETATYINGLITTNPTSSDPKSQGDDHLRLVKSTVKATFPNITGAVTPTQADLNVLAGAATGGVAMTLSSLNTGQLAGLRNKIINGNMDVWQRGTSFTVNNNAAYTSDRMNFTSAGVGNTTVAQAAVAAGSQASINTGANYTLNITGVAGLSYYLLAQHIEGVSTFQSKTITCSIYCDQPAPTGAYFRALQFFGSGGSANVSTDVNVVSTAVGSHYRWTATIAVPSISGKTITTSDYLGVALILVPSNFTVTYRFYGLQAELGSVATPFEQRPIGMELALCQRYYYDSRTATQNPNYWGGAHNNASLATNVAFPVSMRAIPSVGIFSYNNTAGKVSGFAAAGDVGGTVIAATNQISKNGFIQLNDSGTAFTAGLYYWFAATASAEL